MKFNHHLDTKNSNTKNFIKNLSPEIIVQTSSSPIGSYDSGQEINREYISWLESMGIQHINAASKDYDATVLIFDKTV